MDSAGTPLPSTPYMLLYKTEGESIDVIYDKYKDDAHLQALFIVSGDSYEPLALNSLQLHDLSLLISIIPRKFQSKILSLAHNTKYLEASVTGVFPGFIHGSQGKPVLAGCLTVRHAKTILYSTMLIRDYVT